MIGDWRSRSLLYHYMVELQSVHADKSLMYACRFVLHASYTLLIHTCKCRVCCDFLLVCCTMMANDNNILHGAGICQRLGLSELHLATGRQHSSMLCIRPVVAIAKVSVRLSVTLCCPIKTVQFRVTKSSPSAP